MLGELQFELCRMFWYMRFVWAIGVVATGALSLLAQDARIVRLANATSICESNDETVEWSKELKNFNSQPTFRAIHRAMTVASVGMQRLVVCEHVDLVVKFHADFTDSPRASMTVTDSDSAEVVFAEVRDAADMSNDLYRLARQFQSARTNAKATVEIYRLAIKRIAKMKTWQPPSCSPQNSASSALCWLRPGRNQCPPPFRPARSL
jgi:hypothetical protein